MYIESDQLTLTFANTDRADTPTLAAPLPPRTNPILEQRMMEVLKSQPRFAELRDRLLTLGGQVIVPFPESHVNEILDGGKQWPTTALSFEPGEPSCCHENTAALWFVRRNKGFAIIAGWSLSDDGLWVQHSWGWQDGHIIETTDQRVMYYGVRLSLGESLKYFFANLVRPNQQRFMEALDSPEKIRPILGNAARRLRTATVKKLMLDLMEDSQLVVEEGGR